MRLVRALYACVRVGDRVDGARLRTPTPAPGAEAGTGTPSKFASCGRPYACARVGDRVDVPDSAPRPRLQEPRRALAGRFAACERLYACVRVEIGSTVQAPRPHPPLQEPNQGMGSARETIVAERAFCNKQPYTG